MDGPVNQLDQEGQDSSSKKIKKTVYELYQRDSEDLPGEISAAISLLNAGNLSVNYHLS